mmetsp:Transcript_32561/g.59513  ORF Transcript_32561/g.59513 Transcript_32561/m.59513 type:complete len:786 (+) Transcript_32561:78-2435(+)
MSSGFVDTVSTAANVGYSLVVDLLGMAPRPLVFLNAVNPEQFRSLAMFRDGGIFIGAIGTLSIVATGASVGVILGGCGGEGPLRGLSFISGLGYLADALSQLPRIVLLEDGTKALLEHEVGLAAPVYPASRTGLITLLLQLPAAVSMVVQNPVYPPMPHYGLLGLGLSLRYMSVNLAAAGGAGSRLLYAAAIPAFALSITPRQFYEVAGRAAQYVGKKAWSAFQVVYAAVQYAWPRVRDIIVSIAEHPACVTVYRRLVLPVWLRTTPWLLPAATAAISYSCARAVRIAAADGSLMTGDASKLLVGQVFVGSAAAVSSAILLGHGLDVTFMQQRADPLKRRTLYNGLVMLSCTVSLPWRIAQAGALLFFEHVLRHVGMCIVNVLSAAVQAPILTIPAVIIGNIVLMQTYAQGGFQWLRTLEHHFGSVGALLAAGIQQMQKGSMSDSTFAVVCMAISQIGAFATVRAVLLQVPQEDDLRGSTLAFAVMEEVASTLRDPRQCARCHFGPVDFSGCTNLRSHHGEVNADGSRVNNACPRCQWFSASREDWPRWDAHLHTRRGRAILRQRAWADIAMILRAASKALVVPFSLLRLSSACGMAPSVSAFFALSYLLPWAVQNWKLAMVVFTEQELASTMKRLYEERGEEQEQGPVVNVEEDEEDDADCGARRNEVLLPGVTMSEALVNMTTASPDRIFLREGEGCSVCLCDWPKAAVQIASDGGGEEASTALRALVPPIVALRCGHPLHLECAQAALEAASRAAGGQHHVRCPLCREPVTLTGAAAARLFS